MRSLIQSSRQPASSAGSGVRPLGVAAAHWDPGVIISSPKQKGRLIFRRVMGLGLMWIRVCSYAEACKYRGMVCVLCNCACGCARVDGVCLCLQYIHLCCERAYVVYLHTHVCIWVTGFWLQGMCR